MSPTHQKDPLSLKNLVLIEVKYYEIVNNRSFAKRIHRQLS